MEGLETERGNVTSVTDKNMTKPLTAKKLWLLAEIGFVGWLVATIAFRLVGQYLLNPDSILVVILTFIASVVLLAPLVFLYPQLGIKPTDRPFAAVVLALPGMLLDVVTTVFFSTAFPNMAASANGLFGGLMLWGYSLILLTGIFAARKG